DSDDATDDIDRGVVAQEHIDVRTRSEQVALHQLREELVQFGADRHHGRGCRAETECAVLASLRELAGGTLTGALLGLLDRTLEHSARFRIHDRRAYRCIEVREIPLQWRGLGCGTHRERVGRHRRDHSFSYDAFVARGALPSTTTLASSRFRSHS